MAYDTQFGANRLIPANTHLLRPTQQWFRMSHAFLGMSAIQNAILGVGASTLLGASSLAEQIEDVNARLNNAGIE